MRTIRLVLALVCACPLLAPAQDSSDDARTRSKIIALEQLWNQAEQRKDTRAMDAIFDNSLVYVDYDGRLMTKAEFLININSGGPHPEQIVTESITVAVFGSTAIASGIYHAKGMQSGKPYLRRGRFVDTWVYKNASWVCIASQATPTLR